MKLYNNKETRRMALKRYLEGLGFRAIYRLLQISRETVYAWVKTWGPKVDLPKKEEGIAFMELDEVLQQSATHD
jgi:transposase-like protein